MIASVPRNQLLNDGELTKGFVKMDPADEFHYFPFRAMRPLEGIINFLTQRGDGNAHGSGLISASALNTYNKDCAARNAADLTTKSHFYSGNQPNQWLMYDFKQMRITISGYTLRTYADAAGGRHLKSWVIETSIGGSNPDWITIDEREGNSDLNSPEAIASFEVSNLQPARYVRIRATGPCHNDVPCILIYAWELFGTLTIPE
jgi:hypothetical protein